MRITPRAPRWFIANRVRVLVDGASTAGAFDQIDMWGANGDMPPLHVHRNADETFTVLEGAVEVHVGDDAFVVGPGEALVAPRGVPHTYRVVSEEPARWLITCSPAGFADFVAAASDAAEGDGLPPEGRPVDLDRVGRGAAAVGIDLLGPPGMLPRDLP